MQFFIDTADINEIRELVKTGFVDGVTTNPTLIAKSGRKFREVIKEICEIVEGPVSAEVVSTDFEGMLKEGRELAQIAENVAVKLPLTWDGLRVCKILTSEGVMVNVTLCFSASQALLAAKAGATFISPFIGRLDDISQEGLQLIEDIVSIYNNYPELETQVLVASVRSPMHVVNSAKMGAHVATLPPAVLKQMVSHPLTTNGLNQFIEDSKKFVA